jgi:hypothetical protein
VPGAVAFGVEGSAVRFNDRAGDGEADAAAAAVAAAGAVGAVEALEDPFQLVGVEAVAAR